MSDRLPRLAAIILLTWTSSLLVASAWAHGVTLKVQHPLGEDSAFHTQFLVPWAEKIEKESGGRLRIHLYPAMQL